ncbi:hypothetical protein [Mesorhizobium sp. M1396]|uniref:hypothetical protein n=1 Tax=Mesorhizobium sp. M1396 TaxID=2957095 RepID=UPI00333930AF
MERLKELGIGLLEIPLLRPEEIDTKQTRAFAERQGIELIPSLGLPRALDVVERPDEALAVLEPAFGFAKRSSRPSGLRSGRQRGARRRHLWHDRQDLGPCADHGRSRRHVPDSSGARRRLPRRMG